MSTRACVICSEPIVYAHLGVHCCRACAVFYNRATKSTKQLKCKGTGDCIERSPKATCRLCRFTKIYDLLKRASGEQESIVVVADAEEHHEEARIPTFIDHESYFENISSTSETPLLDRMKRAYSMLCIVRRAGEMSQQKVRNFQENMTLVPAKYQTVIPYMRIFMRGIVDFARSSFEDFNNLPAESRHVIVIRNFMLMLSLDIAYRSHHHFPDDATVMASYTTYLNDGLMEQFFADCPHETNVAAAIEKNKENFMKIKPSSDEFVALFGLAFWNDNTTDLSSDRAQLVDASRSAIMGELHKLYARNKKSDYAARLGEIMCLLVNVESVLNLSHEDIQVYRMMNLFNEAFEDQ